jgi:hypothetical protein
LAAVPLELGRVGLVLGAPYLNFRTTLQFYQFMEAKVYFLCYQSKRFSVLNFMFCVEAADCSHRDSLLPSQHHRQRRGMEALCRLATGDAAWCCLLLLLLLLLEEKDGKGAPEHMCVCAR